MNDNRIFAKDLIENFLASAGAMPREVRLFTRLLLHKIADNTHRLHLADGQSLNDGTDFSASLRELAEAMMPPEPSLVSNLTCPDCDHEHEGRDKCGHYLGEGKFCQCPSKVAA